MCQPACPFNTMGDSVKQSARNQHQQIGQGAVFGLAA
jgi:hypothetical protein